MYKKYDIIGEKLYSGTLPNGLPVFVVPKSGFSKKYAFFAVRYGGADSRFILDGRQTDTPVGVAHFLEHKMFDTEHGDAMIKLSSNGASPNAYTSIDTTAYYFECSDKFTENLKTLLNFVSIPYFTPESVDKEMGIIGQEILMCEDDPDECLYYGFLRSLFKHNPLRDPITGTLDSISEISAETLYKCHEIFYSPSNMALCVAGDLDPSEIFETAHNILPESTSKFFLHDYGPPEKAEPEKRLYTRSMDVSMPVFIAGCKSKPSGPGINRLKQELVGALALELLAGHSSPLYFRLYAEGLISGDFSASFDAAAGTAYSMFGGETHDPERVFNEVINELVRLTEHGPDAKLFGRIKKALLGSQIRALNSFGAICTGIAEGHFLGYDVFEASEIIDSVTEDEIVAFLRENLLPDNMTMAIVKDGEQQ